MKRIKRKYAKLFYTKNQATKEIDDQIHSEAPLEPTFYPIAVDDDNNVIALVLDEEKIQQGNDVEEEPCAFLGIESWDSFVSGSHEFKQPSSQNKSDMILISRAIISVNPNDSQSVSAGEIIVYFLRCQLDQLKKNDPSIRFVSEGW